ncbi:methyl-accepting chemotaxis protein [Acidithiobacillus caldus]|nr:methyl-accepting chemotaxis protein [Acidithiobacillus caldus]MBU2729628.1 methyl-accepting chemotaxis protein [Acidithiobacillus caldus]MBU2734231.1 methyl-accepting chemotaxis protein [Acidithiobacillus caldus ATCC 51756]MBU2746077.1 methyl-accepting chemotaxis protein [Acidithiobacillus caldus]MBU2779668.1 methyl-accepting chemotaxis protein [Acidithiobacillus caldus]
MRWARAITSEKRVLSRQTSSSAGFYDWMFWTLIFAGFLAISVIWFLGSFTVRRIEQHLKRVESAIRSIVDGKYMATLPLETVNTVGGIADAMNMLADQLQRMSLKTSSAIRLQICESQNIVAETSGLSERMTFCRDHLVSINASLGEIVETVERDFHLVEEFASGVLQAKALTESNSDVCNNTIDTIRAFEQPVEHIAGSIAHIVAASEHIDSIIGVIQEIARQTHMLGLNAAIEAARAGESGWGFAVVADEVRELAIKTRGATDDICLWVQKVHSQTVSASSYVAEFRSLIHGRIKDGQADSERVEMLSSAMADLFDGASGLSSTARSRLSLTSRINDDMRNVLECLNKTEEIIQCTRAKATAVMRSELKLCEYLAQFLDINYPNLLYPKSETVMLDTISEPGEEAVQSGN